MNPIRLIFDGRHQWADKSIIFPGGEVHAHLTQLPGEANSIVIKCWLMSSDDIMNIFMVCNILRTKYPQTRLALDIGCMPYARQDRICADGDAFSFDVFTRLLNMAEVDVIYTRDIHSKAAEEVLKTNTNARIVVHHQAEAIYDNHNLLKRIREDNVIIVAPDKGATPKARDLAHNLNRDIIFGSKKRDPVTGALTGFEINCGQINIKDRTCFIVDDICDGGGTFLGLAQELKKQGADHIWLYVTHGIFSKGLNIFDGVIDEIFATDTVITARNLKSTTKTKFHLIHL